MNKKLVIFTILALSSLLLIFALQPKRNKSETPERKDLPVATNSSEGNVLVDISQKLSQKYNKPSESFIVSLDTNLGDYAKGTVKFEKEGGGGLWFAAKRNNSWQLVYDGNGIIPCSELKEYQDFPSSLILQCFDTDKNTLVKR